MPLASLCGNCDNFCYLGHTKNLDDDDDDDDVLIKAFSPSVLSVTSVACREKARTAIDLFVSMNLHRRVALLSTLYDVH